ncbi:MAG: tetratricopeptide repeat protein [Candidatus Zixiibacteriota bacterium]
MAGTPKLTKDEKMEEVEKAIEEAKIHRREKRFQKGIDLLSNALRYRVKEDEIYYQLGNIYYDAGDLDRAEDTYQRAIEKNKEHVNAHHNLGVIYKRKGRIWEFVKMKKKATKLAPKNPVK